MRRRMRSVCGGWTVSADEGNNLIWAPSKTGENAYRLRLGAQYSGSVDVSGGSDFSVSATKAGRVQAPPSVGIWGLLSRQKKGRPGRYVVAGMWTSGSRPHTVPAMSG